MSYPRIDLDQIAVIDIIHVNRTLADEHDTEFDLITLVTGTYHRAKTRVSEWSGSQLDWEHAACGAKAKEEFQAIGLKVVEGALHACGRCYR